VETVTRFWRHIFGGERGLLQIWTGIRCEDDKTKFNQETIRLNNFNYPKAVDNAAEWALQKAEEPKREVYFCTHLLTGPERRKENAADVRALWGELDGVDVPNGELKPTGLIESSPGRYHCYWGLADAIPAKTAEDLNARLAHAIGADPSGFDLTQLLRVPDTLNNKYEGTPSVRLDYLDGSRTYVAGDLDRALPQLQANNSSEQPNEGAHDPDEPPVVLSPEGLEVWRGQHPKYKKDSPGEIDTSATLLKIGRVIYDAGANRQVIIGALKERDASLGYHKYTDRRDDREYERIFDKELSKNGRNTYVRLGGGHREEGVPQSVNLETPIMGEAAFRGLFGRIVDMVDPHTEGDRVAVLGSALTYFGNVMGRGPYMMVGATSHHANLFCALVGRTAKGRKGSASDPVGDILQGADEDWYANRIASGLSSGEGLISEVRDPVKAPGNDGEMKTVDPGVEDKRLLVVEGEMAQALKVMRREGNTLSPVLRNGWDGKTLRTMTKQSPLKATRPHVSILGHVTEADLTRHLTETEMANGLANRFIWLQVKRSKSLPFGGEWFSVDKSRISQDLQRVLKQGAGEFRVCWDEEAKPLWEEAYEDLTAERAGMFGAITARAEAQALRLAMVYALAGESQRIQKAHVESALAVWTYAEESARHIFGDAIGDPDADRVLNALRLEPEGLSRTDIRDLFGRNKSANDLDRIAQVLVSVGRLQVTREATEGSKKPVEWWRAL
jgi:hypothetical protein